MSTQTPFLGRGWAFPPSFGAGGSEVEMVSGPSDVHEAVQIILRTTPGERVMQETFGCDLASMMFAEIDRALLNKLERLISNALLNHEPRIKVDEVSIASSDSEQGLLLITLRYSIRGTNSRFNMVYPFYVMEASHGGP